MPVEKADLAVIGGGIVGLATSLQLLRRRPQLRLVVLEREPEVAMHQSGHNSGVAHAGLYYKPRSLKPPLRRGGTAELAAYCAEHEIPLRRIGTVGVALDEGGAPPLHALCEPAPGYGVD